MKNNYQRISALSQGLGLKHRAIAATNKLIHEVQYPLASSSMMLNSHNNSQLSSQTNSQANDQEFDTELLKSLFADDVDESNINKQKLAAPINSDYNANDGQNIRNDGNPLSATFDKQVISTNSTNNTNSLNNDSTSTTCSDTEHKKTEQQQIEDANGKKDNKQITKPKLNPPPIVFRFFLEVHQSFSDA